MAESNVVYVEHCVGCESHAYHTRHKAQLYQKNFEWTSAAIRQACPEITVTANEVFQDDSRGSSSRTQGKVRYPRVGAFEVYFRGRKVFSKLDEGMWPNADFVAGKVKRIRDGLEPPSPQRAPPPIDPYYTSPPRRQPSPRRPQASPSRSQPMDAVARPTQPSAKAEAPRSNKDLFTAQKPKPTPKKEEAKKPPPKPAEPKRQTPMEKTPEPLKSSTPEKPKKKESTPPRTPEQTEEYKDEFEEEAKTPVARTPEPAAKAPEPKEKTPEPPVKTPEPPVKTPEPPVKTPEPPVKASEPPTKIPETPEPPVRTPEPPVKASEPPVKTPEPPAKSPEPPVYNPEHPVKSPEPPVKSPEPPVKETPEPAGKAAEAEVKAHEPAEPPPAKVPEPVAAKPSSAQLDDGDLDDMFPEQEITREIEITLKVGETGKQELPYENKSESTEELTFKSSNTSLMSVVTPHFSVPAGGSVTAMLDFASSDQETAKSCVLYIRVNGKVKQCIKFQVIYSSQPMEPEDQYYESQDLGEVQKPKEEEVAAENPVVPSDTAEQPREPESHEDQPAEHEEPPKKPAEASAPEQQDEEQKDAAPQEGENAPDAQEPPAAEEQLSFEVQLPIGRPSNKVLPTQKISYENSESEPLTIEVTSSDPALMEVKEPSLTIPPGEVGKIKLGFRELTEEGEKVLSLAIHANGTLRSTIEIKAIYVAAQE